MSDFKTKLYQKSKEYGFELTEKMLNDFEIYKNLLIEWNKVMNLTAITDEDEIILKHFVDSLFCTKYIKNNTKIIDVGTGAGFPGLPIAIYMQDKVEVTLLDSLNKRINFLNEVKQKLELNNVITIHARAEELSHDEKYREKYDHVVSRAVANLAVLSEFDLPYLKVDGIAVIMKGSNYKEEIQNAKNALVKLNSKIILQEEYFLEDEIKHSIIQIKKNKKIDLKYPRVFGKIKKSPL